MQSAAPVPEDSSWKKTGFYLWLLAIVAMIYNSTVYKGYKLKNYPVWVFFLLLLYYMFTKTWYNLCIELGDNENALIFNGFLSIAIFFALLALLIRYIRYSNNYTAFIIYLSLFFVGGMWKVYTYRKSTPPRQYSLLLPTLNSIYFVLSVLFPSFMIYNATNDANAIYEKEVEDASASEKDSVPSPMGYKIVVGSAITIMMLALIKFRWNHADLMQSTKLMSLSNVKYFIETFPLIQYFKYVVDNDYIDGAKRITVIGLLAYVAYLMYSVYIKKNALTPCTESSFASCFDHPQFFSKLDTPYVNTLVWVLVYCSALNIVNWITKTFGTSLISKLGSSPVNNPPTDIGMLVRLLVFPFYWIVTMFAQHPVTAIISFIAFAVLGLFLYRSSFNLTSFIEGQRGIVISLFTLFIVSLLVFGVYTMQSSTTDMVQGIMSYGQFIAKTGMFIAVAVCAVGLLMYCLNSHSKLANIVNIAQYGITTLIYVVGIAIVIGLARTVFSTSRKMGDSMFQVSADSNWVVNVLKLFGNLLFYLPCLMLDTVDMLKKQYGLITQTTLILLALEAIFILAGHLLPSAVVKAINHTGVHLLSAPISTTTLTTVTKYEIQFVDAHGVAQNPLPSSGVATAVLLQNYNYGVSAWFYLHPQPPNTNANYDAPAYMKLLQIGSFGPAIQYNPKANAMQFSIYGTPIQATITDIPIQTWNNVVINSDKGVVDIFINNKLVYTGNHLPNSPDHGLFTVSIGQADGIHGEMCNVMLNTTPFTKTEIAWLYKTNRTLNPPVVGADMDQATDTPMPTYSASGLKTFGILGAVFGALFGWLFNDQSSAIKGVIMGAIVFGLIGALLGTLFSTDGTLAYLLKTGANVFVDTF
jgi:hypothetical protein